MPQMRTHEQRGFPDFQPLFTIFIFVLSGQTDPVILTRNQEIAIDF